jgi:hypothetical protein
MTESERLETLIERLKSRKDSYQRGQKIQQWLHVEERDLIVKKFSIGAGRLLRGYWMNMNDRSLVLVMAQGLILGAFRLFTRGVQLRMHKLGLDSYHILEILGSVKAF